MSFTEYLTEVTAEEKYNKQYKDKISREVFDKAVKADPTSVGEGKVGKYTDWIIKTNAYEDGDITEMLADFERYKENFDADKRDINKFTYSTFVPFIERMGNLGKLVSNKEVKDSNKEKAAQESETVFKDDRYIVVVPKTLFASRYYGCDSKWCTANRDTERFYNSYSSRGTLYIIYDKAKKTKYQVFLGEDNEGNEYKDIKNNDIDPRALFASDKKLIEYFDSVDMPEETGPKYVTQEEINRIAEESLEDCEIYQRDFTDEEWPHIFQMAVNRVREDVDNYIENDHDEQGVDYDLARELFRGNNISWGIDSAIEYLQKRDGIANSSRNRANIYPYAYDGFDYEIKQGHTFAEDEMERYDWDYDSLELDLNSVDYKASNLLDKFH